MRKSIKIQTVLPVQDGPIPQANIYKKEPVQGSQMTFHVELLTKRSQDQPNYPTIISVRPPKLSVFNHTTTSVFNMSSYYSEISDGCSSLRKNIVVAPEG